MKPCKRRPILFLSFPLLLLASNVLAATRTNVLLISVDDLRPELGCYGSPWVHSPEIDRFAATSLLFQRAYCQQAVCNPSRTSLMTGRRPDTIGVTGNHSHFRNNHPDVVTMPQHFKRHGYHTAAIGKIYHGVFPEGASKTKWDTMGDPESWSVPAVRFGPRYYYTEEGISAAKEVFHRIYKPKNPQQDDWTKKLVFGPATESPDVSDNTLYDGKVADAAVEKLSALQASGQPFFLAVGFIKPHSPYIAPKKYFDLYQDVTLATQTQFPIGAPNFAGHNSGELRRYTDQPMRGEIPNYKQREVRHAYYACVSYIDAQIGRLLSELDRLGLSENTVVVLYGDHGYHLGEQGLWGKTTNFELDTRVPLLVRTPGMNAAGKSSSSIVELIDLYPTLTELAGLPIPPQLEGTSFVPILNDPTLETKNAAISQYPRTGELMGYSMRTPTHRLTQWIHRPTGEVKATELYDYAEGPIETKNIAASSPTLVDELSEDLAAATKRRIFVNQLERHEVTKGSFEEAVPGPFQKLKTTLGVWQPSEGNSVIDDKHARTGDQCLHLTGDKATSVTLELTENVDTTGEMTFWAERWTKREPFSFRIDKDSGTGWEEVFNGDKHVRVGRSFLSHITVPLGDPKIKRFRFTAKSPPNTGVLIDDVRIAPALPQKIDRVESVPLSLPALVGVDASPLLKLKITTKGTLDPISLTELRFSLRCKAGDVESTTVFYGGSNDQFATTKPFGQVVDSAGQKEDGTRPLSITGKQSLVEGENYIWITCKLSDDANLDHSVGAECTRVAFSNGETMDLAAASNQRIGVALRKGGDDGANRYRIPAWRPLTREP